ncbi:peptidylprolyl isomerase [Granulosicoccaceae sp. 1_MG-2023]|nr:peptidylprolyl isomerase [Granulosicoccaceae sp. 1_MG-2023]
MQKRIKHGILAAILLLALPALALAAGSEQVRISTSKGDIIVELDSERAPESVANFLAYVDDGFYNGTIFHRVIDGFMIQGGGYTDSFAKKETRAPIPNEANNGLKNRKYTIAMARTNAPHSATSQFFINTVDNDFLNHTSMDLQGWGYTVFGRVIEGFDVVDAISQSRTGPGGPFPRDVPAETVRIESATRVTAAENADQAAALEPADSSQAQ